MSTGGNDADYAHSGSAENRRRQKALALARFAWERAVTGEEMLAMPARRRRQLAREVGVHPPGTEETWRLVAELLDAKDAWAHAHPDHPDAIPAHADEKITWVRPR